LTSGKADGFLTAARLTSPDGKSASPLNRKCGLNKSQIEEYFCAKYKGEGNAKHIALAS